LALHHISVQLKKKVENQDYYLAGEYSKDIDRYNGARAKFSSFGEEVNRVFKDLEAN
jgi:hypothetical protein